MKVKSNNSCAKRGFSTIEIAITVTVLAALSAIGVGAYVKIGSLTKQAKLSNDLQILNTAINAYINFGGDLGDSETTETVIRKLKSRASKETARTVVGMSHSFLDPRLDVVMQSSGEAESNMPRIHYDSAKKKFVTATEGTSGIRAFRLRDTIEEGDEQAIEDRTSIVTFAKDSTWVWDYGVENGPPPPDGPTVVTTTPIPVTLVPPTTPTNPPVTTLPLQPPLISPPSGDYPTSDFDISVTINDNNPAGRSALVYSLNYGDWLPYTGAIDVPPNADIRAQATPQLEEWTASSVTTAAYGMLPGALTAPAITLSAASFDETTPTIDVAISNPNGTGVSVLFYALRAPDGSYPDIASHSLYSGIFTVDSTTYPDGFFVQAYAKSVDAGAWGDSPFTEASAQASFFEIPLTGDRILFVLDASSSMDSEYCDTGLERYEIAVSELSTAISGLPSSKQFGIAMFDAGQHWIYNGSNMLVADSANKQAAITAVSAVPNDSGTSYEVGLAYPLQFTPQPDQVIFLSDGSPNSSTGWHDELAALKAAGIQVDCVGIQSDESEKANLNFIASETGGMAKFLDCD